jgi:hypothetical protein
MSLRNLLKNPTEYVIGGVSQIDFKQKSILYPDGPYDKRPLLGERVTFDITDENAKPTFRGVGRDHGTFGGLDAFIRGGASVAFSRRLMDADRIGRFLYTTPEGIQFLATQTALQLLNPRPQTIYNLGVNTLASVAAAGVSNVTRGGVLGGTIGNFLGGIFKEQNYLTDIEKDYDDNPRIFREINYGLGDPGKPSSKSALEKLKDLNPFKEKNREGYNVSLAIDQVNFAPIFQDDPARPDSINSSIKDFIPFRFEIINQDSGHNDIIVFRAFLDNISDDYSATHNTYKYNGRGEEFFTYNKFARKIQFSFKVAAQSRHEMMPIYQKLNYLVAQTAPNYSSTGRIRTPFLKLTIGDWFNKLPGLITSVGLSWQKDYPWEIVLDRYVNKEGYLRGKDKDMLILPHVLDVSVSFQPIHDFVPNNTITSPFIGIHGNANWMQPKGFSTSNENDLSSVGGLVYDILNPPITVYKTSNS